MGKVADAFRWPSVLIETPASGWSENGYTFCPFWSGIRYGF